MQKTIDLGEYKIKIYYDPKNSDLSVQVLDELNNLIESIDINDDEEEEMSEDEPDFNLN